MSGSLQSWKSLVVYQNFSDVGDYLMSRIFLSNYNNNNGSFYSLSDTDLQTKPLFTGWCSLSIEVHWCPFLNIFILKNTSESGNLNSDNDASSPSLTTNVSLFLILLKVGFYPDPLTHFGPCSLNMKFFFWRRP